MDHPAQAVAPHGLHHRVTVHPGSEARPHADDHRGIGDPGAQIPLGQDGVHHPVKGQLHQNGRLRIAEHGNLPPLQRPAGRPGVLRPAGGDPLHLGRAVVHALGEGHRPTHRRGPGHLRHDHRYARPVQPHRRAGGQISRSLDQNQHNPPRSSSR